MLVEGAGVNAVSADKSGTFVHGWHMFAPVVLEYMPVVSVVTSQGGMQAEEGAAKRGQHKVKQRGLLSQSGSWEPSGVQGGLDLCNIKCGWFFQKTGL